MLTTLCALIVALGRLASVGLVRRALMAALVLAAHGALAFADERHGFAIYSELQRPADFSHFDYANIDARQGGTVSQGTTITFDSTNLLRFPGKVPNEFTYIYDTLMVRALDEPASFYGLLAQSVELSDDFSTARFTLRPEARWHDGQPVTAQDVVFTFETLGRYGLPSYRSTLAPVEISAESDAVVVFRSSAPGDWRYLDLVAQFPIHPAHFWATRDTSRTTLDVPLGSGPYSVASMQENDRVVLERVPAYWGGDLPVNRGRWNFDRIDTLYFRDYTALIQTLTAGRTHVNREHDAGYWLRAYDVAALESGRLVRSTFRDRDGGVMVAVMFNLRRPPLDDPRVREALTLAYDGDWTRQTFFGDLRGPPGTPYGSTAMAADGPALGTERGILAPFAAELPEGILAAPAPPDIDGLDRRARLRRADALLSDAGFVIRDGKRVDAQTGEPLEFVFVSTRASYARIMEPYAQELENLGVSLQIRIFDYVTGRHRILGHDFDLTSGGFGPRFPPGRDERVYWHSERANEPGYALAGATDAALDATIEAMNGSTGYTSLIEASRAFERVLQWRRYMLPLWRVDDIWIAHHRDLVFPEDFVFPDFHYLPYLSWRDGSEPAD